MLQFVGNLDVAVVGVELGEEAGVVLQFVYQGLQSVGELVDAFLVLQEVLEVLLDLAEQRMISLEGGQ